MERRSVALVFWGDLFEDYLDHLGVSLQEFQSTFTGSWIFAYIQALQAAGIRSVLFCVSSRLKQPVRFRHAPSGASVTILPTPTIHRSMTAWIRKLDKGLGEAGIVRRVVRGCLAELAPYLDLPLSTFARELRREACDVILCQQYEYQRFDVCVLLGTLLRVPVFATYQGGGDERGSGRLERWTRPLALRACDGLIIAAQAEALRLRARYAVSPVKVGPIFNPIDTASWRALDRASARARLGIPEGASVVVWHGRVEHWKGLDLLLHAWARICRERPGRDLRLLIVGTGSDAEALRGRIATMELRTVHQVDRFVGDRDEIRSYLSAADVYAFPSREEGFAVAPLEAMACGLPVVAADAHGVSDLFKDGEASGGIVVPCDDPGALASAVRRLLDDDALRIELGRRARHRVDACFSMPTIGEQLRAFLLDGSSRRVWPRPDIQATECLPEPMLAPLRLRAIWPTQTQAGSSFNIRHDGQSVLSVEAENANRGTLVVLGKRRLVTSYGDPSFLTASIPPALLRKARRYRVYLTDGARRSNQLELIVTERPVAPVTVTGDHVTPEMFRASLDFFTCPSEMKAGQQQRIEMNVRNDSPVAWPVTSLGTPAVRVTCHWLTSTGDVHDYGGVQTELPRTLGPNQTTRIGAWVRAPEECGTFMLQLDLLIEQVAWFSTQGWTGPVCRVEILPSTLSSERVR